MSYVFLLIILVPLVLLLLLVFMVAGFYNRLVTLRNRFKNAYAQIDVQLKRRYDLIPNLVETAKGYMKHERETLEAVIKARNQAVSAGNQAAQHPESAQAIKGVMGAEATLTGVLGRLFALVENYPDLKANQNMAKLMEELTATENKVSFARQAYNDSVMQYNTVCESIPYVFIASPLGFQKAQLFEIEKPEEREAPKVNLLEGCLCAPLQCLSREQDHEHGFL